MKNNMKNNMMEAAMQYIRNRKHISAALAACLFLGGTAAVTGAEAKAAPAKAPAKAEVKAAPAKAAPAKVAVKAEIKAAPAQPKLDPALQKLLRDERVKRDDLDLNARAKRDLGREYVKQGYYEKAINEFVSALDLWKKCDGGGSVMSARYKNDIESMQKEIADTYRIWAQSLYDKAAKLVRLLEADQPTAAKIDNVRKAIGFCKKAMEMYPPCKDAMEKEIEKYEGMIYSLEFKKDVALQVVDRDNEDNKSETELQLQRGRALYKIGRLNQARQCFERVIAREPYNSVAIDYLRRIYLKLERIGTQRKELELAKAIDEVAWNPIAPILLNEIDPVNEEEAKEAVEKTPQTNRQLYELLRKVKLTHLEFNETPLNQVIEYLQGRAAKETNQHINFVLRFNAPAAKAASDGDSESEDDSLAEESSEETVAADSASAKMPKVNFMFGDADSLQEQSLYDIIKVICENTTYDGPNGQEELYFRVEEHAVVIAPKSVVLDDLVTELFPVDKAALSGAINGDPEDEEKLKSYFKKYNITFDNKATVRYHEKMGCIVMTNTPENIDITYELVKGGKFETDEPQIQVQVKFTEVTMNDLEELGAEYIFSRETISKDFSWEQAKNMSESAWNEAYQEYLKTGIPPQGAGVKYTTQPPPAEAEPTIKTVQDPNTLKWWQVTIPPDKVENITSYTSKKRTFKANDSLVRNAQADYLAFGSATERPDTVFDWSYARHNGYNMNIKIHALDQADSVDVLSSPRVTTLNGESATVKMVTQKYYPDSWGEAEVSEVDALSVFVPSTPEFADAVEEGVALNVTPSIADGNKFAIKMQMNPVILEFAGWTDYSYEVILGENNGVYMNTLKMPIIQMRSVNTEVECYDKSTIVLGGVLKNSVSSVDDQYPILGDIPIIGRLFQTKGKGSAKTSLLIFVTGTMVNVDGTPWYH